MKYTNSNLFDFYDHVKDDLKFLIKSDVRIRILISLSEGTKNIAQLKGELGITSSAILHGMYQLENKNLITRESGNYSLSPPGEIYSYKLMDIIRSISVLGTCQNIFLKHEINCIPPELLRDLGCLKDSQIIKPVPTDVLRPCKIFIQNLYESARVKHLSSVLYTPIIKLLFSNIEEREVHLILTREVLDKMQEEVDRKVFDNSLASGNLKLGVINDDTKICFTMGNKFISMGLYFLNGEYDLNNLLMDESREAISWGERLFKHYQDASIDFHDL